MRQNHFAKSLIVSIERLRRSYSSKASSSGTKPYEYHPNLFNESGKSRGDAPHASPAGPHRVDHGCRQRYWAGHCNRLCSRGCAGRTDGRRVDALAETASEIGQAAIVVPADVTDADLRSTKHTKPVNKAWGAVDVLVNNAGRNSSKRHLRQLTVARRCPASLT